MLSSLSAPHFSLRDMENSWHYQEKACSYKNLDKAHEKAQGDSNYNSCFVRMQITSIFGVCLGFCPYLWQLDVAEAIILSLDSMVIASTGSGKTIPFMLPLLHDPTKKELVISPLKVLQEDQVHLHLLSCCVYSLGLYHVCGCCEWGHMEYAVEKGDFSQFSSHYYFGLTLST